MDDGLLATNQNLILRIKRKSIGLGTGQTVILTEKLFMIFRRKTILGTMTVDRASLGRTKSARPTNIPQMADFAAFVALWERASVSSVSPFLTPFTKPTFIDSVTVAITLFAIQ
jgi:hypothetical protein